MCACVLSCFSCVWLFATPCSPLVPSVPGILQARILEWVAVPSSRGSSQPTDHTCISGVSCTGRRILHLLCHSTTWYIFLYSLIFKPEFKIYVLPIQSSDFLVLRSGPSHGAMQVKSLQVSLLAPILVLFSQEVLLGICTFSQCKWGWENTDLFYLISPCSGYGTLFYTPTKINVYIITCIIFT